MSRHVHKECGSLCELVRDTDAEDSQRYLWCVQCYEPLNAASTPIDTGEVVGWSYNSPTPYLLECAQHGQVFITEDEFNKQISSADDDFICPLCRAAGNDVLAREAHYNESNFKNKMLR